VHVATPRPEPRLAPGPTVFVPREVAPITLPALGELHLPTLPRSGHLTLPPLLPASTPLLPTDLPSPVDGHTFPGSLAVLVAVAAAASLLARRLRFAAPVWQSLAFASLIERPG
jgi:hypothetical protein